MEDAVEVEGHPSISMIPFGYNALRGFGGTSPVLCKFHEADPCCFNVCFFFVQRVCETLAGPVDFDCSRVALSTFGEKVSSNFGGLLLIQVLGEWRLILPFALWNSEISRAWGSFIWVMLLRFLGSMVKWITVYPSWERRELNLAWKFRM